MFKKLLIVGLMASATATAFGQTATPRIDKREANQEQRINQGVESGALTNRETKTLDAREGRIARNEAAAKSDGVVTRAERAKLRGEERRTSRAIHRKKHNARTAP